MSTTGGLYAYENDVFIALNPHLTQLNLSCLATNNGYLWVGSSQDGIIQILDNQLDHFLYINYPVFDSIKKIVFSDDYGNNNSGQKNQLILRLLDFYDKSRPNWVYGF